jgi:hypothetical protein
MDLCQTNLPAVASDDSAGAVPTPPKRPPIWLLPSDHLVGISERGGFTTNRELHKQIMDWITQRRF